jgi:predicted phage terminase large subunit-like protein
LLWELNKRKIKRGGFIEYCQHFAPRLCSGFDFEMASHHLIMARELEISIRESEYNVMFLMPPGHAKSTYSSILFPSYFLAEIPGAPFLGASHTTGLAEHFGRQTRNLTEDPFYQYYANASLSKDSKSALRFTLTNGSRFQGAGVGKAIAGFRGKHGHIDDPIKGEEAAHSEVQRDRAWTWYLFDFITRLLPGASQTMSVTTWHEDDLPNRILNSPQGKHWKVIRLPALIETKEQKDNDVLGRDMGAPLWPKVFSSEKLLKIKEGYGKDLKAWESLYQQNPTIETGNYFKKPWIQLINKLPEGLTYFGASDYAVTDGSGDFTVHVVIGFDDKNNDIYIVHVWREQTTTEVWVDEFIKLIKRYKPVMWAEESGQIIKSLDPFIRKQMNDHETYVFREQFTCTTSKKVRAQSFRGFMAQGKVFILNTDWTPMLTRELLSFPDGKNDDQVDALGLIGRMLNEMVIKVEKQKKVFQDGYEAGKIILPGLNDNISKPDGNYRRV